MAPKQHDGDKANCNQCPLAEDHTAQTVINDLHNIKLALVGDDSMGIKGIKHTVAWLHGDMQEVRAEVRELQTWKRRLELKIAAVIGGCLVVGWILENALRK